MSEDNKTKKLRHDKFIGDDEVRSRSKTYSKKGGPMNTIVEYDRGPGFLRCENEHVLQNAKTKDNARIIFGRDRMHVCASGAGGKGAQGAERIEMIVGLASSAGARAG